MRNWKWKWKIYKIEFLITFKTDRLPAARPFVSFHSYISHDMCVCLWFFAVPLHARHRLSFLGQSICQWGQHRHRQHIKSARHWVRKSDVDFRKGLKTAWTARDKRRVVIRSMMTNSSVLHARLLHLTRKRCSRKLSVTNIERKINFAPLFCIN